MKEVDNQNLWKIELGSQENMNVSQWNIIGFQQRERQETQNLNKDTCYRFPVASAQCMIGTEKNFDAGILLNNDDDGCSQGYGQNEEAFKTLTKDDILQPYISDQHFRSSGVRDVDIGCKFR